MATSSDWPCAPWKLTGAECEHETCSNRASFACYVRPGVFAVCTAHLVEMLTETVNVDGLDVGSTPFEVVALRADSDDPI